MNQFALKKEIRHRLEEVKDYQTWDIAQIKLLEKQLRFMGDLPRLHRKILCGLISPQEIVTLFQSYSAIQFIITRLFNNLAICLFN